MTDRTERGQASVELALVLPIVILLMLAVVQVGLVVRDQVLVTHAAREAAREAAVDPNPQAARRAALAGAPLEGDRFDVQLNGRPSPGERVEVTVSFRAPTSTPLVGPLIPELTLRARASMRVE